MRYKAVIVTLFISLLFLSACSSQKTASGEKIYQLNLNVSAGPVHPFTKQVAEPWAEMVEEETNGIVQVNIFPSAALGELSSAYEDIKSGLYEAGIVSPGRHIDTDLFPLTIGDLPFLIDDPAIAESVLSQFKDKYMKDTFKEGQFMSISSTDAYQLYSTQPIRTMKDMKKLKIADSVLERIELFKELDAIPVSLNNTELYESVEKGIVDSVAYTAVGANGFKLEEVSPYMTKVDIGVATQMFMMNQDFLESLPEEIKEMFYEKFGPAYASLITDLYTQSADKAINTFEMNVKEDGGEVIIPTEEELATFRKPAKIVMDQWVEIANKRGYPGEEMMAYFTSLLEDKGIIIPE
ncbi:TRAP transporter substrate-binding protein [Cytobacillus kochii]|uniref:TRAP transporter substrate-binding protein n=1 Tax=Cytobacillus kochii TaxID=859143 RepID=UPI002785E76F|nr:TRAP transporter substrate-binding protein DctP [Cytobacillus kochii]MDQ0184483.1 TRAP-type C4-dicarboxylate transport system substrate-binding protein [Cytobacillus kochii]